MKTMVFIVSITLILFMSPYHSLADEFKLGADEEAYTFAPFTKAYNRNSFYGIYTPSLATSGGESLYLFPNNKFLVTTWCDMCKEETIAEGTYIFKDARIVLDYGNRKAKFKDRLFYEPLFVFEGRQIKKDYITGWQVILISENNLKKIKSEKYFSDYLERRTWFPDWQEIYSELHKTK